MSKKKRNRRPHPPGAPRPPQDAPGQAAVAELDEPEADDADREAPGEPALAAAPSVVALAEAAGPRGGEAPAPAAAPLPAAGWMPHESGDIRGVLIQVGGGRLLLPNATIAEVLSYAEPAPVGAAADWLLGRFRWRGWQLPLVAFSRLAGIGEEQPGLGSKVIVLKALGGDRRIPYFAILTQGFPRLVTVSRAALEIEAGDAPLPDAIHARVRLNEEPALLPDLLRIEELLRGEREAA